MPSLPSTSELMPKVLSMRLREGLSYVVIGRALDISESRARGLAMRGLAWVEERLARENDPLTGEYS